MAKSSIKVSSRKAKGRQLQDWTCNKIAEVINLPCGKSDDHEVKPRPMGQTGPDIILSERARKLFPFTVECKNQKRWAILDFIEQVKANLYENTDWLLVLKRSGRTKKEQTKEIVVLDAEVFFSILKRL